MLQTLSIQNYALIDSIEIGFKSGFSIITGETGAGKSILMDALAFLLGERADSSVLRDNSKNCIIEAVFNIQKYNLKNYFQENCSEVDYDDTTIIRRIITPNGKSRAFVNDTPVSISILKDLGNQLVDVHSQHQNLLLSHAGFQLDVVDNFANNTQLLAEYQQSYKEYKQIQTNLNKLQELASKSKADYDYLSNQYNQLHVARLRNGEQSELEQELEILTNAEEIKTNLSKIDFLLSNESSSIVNQLKDGLNAAQHLLSVFPKAQEIFDRINTAYLDLKDLANDVEILANDIEFDPEKANTINQRLDLIYSLQQKHHLSSVDELILLYKEYEQKLTEIGDYDSRLEELQKQLAQQEDVLKKNANKLTKARKKVIPEIEKQIMETLALLGMPSATFSIDTKLLSEYTPTGIEEINFQFSANKNMPLQEITKVISGGEMSRVMLALKVLISKSVALPTIVFDEIDTGVSGDIADKMGTLMKQLSANMQVLSITHLPQIAGKGNQHYLVYKTEEKETISSNIRLLTKDERINEIAKMLSGSTITPAALKNAKEMLN